MSAKIFSILYCILTTVFVAHGQSNWQQIAQPTTHNLNKASFLDSLRGWVAGDRGTILKTTDGGSTWTSQNSGGVDDIKNIFMLTERIGWAVTWVEFTDTSTYSGSTILKTTNGGTSWSGAQFAEWGKYFYSVTFFDSLSGWIGGDRGDIERTTDGGATWTDAKTDSSIASGFTIRNIRFYSRQYGFAMGGFFDITGTILRTTNGGQFWTGQSISPEPVFDVHFIDSLHVVGVTGDYEYGPSIVKTEDAGGHWEYVYLALWGLPRAMAFRTPAEGWVPLVNQIMVTRDTARTWQVRDTLGARQISDLIFTDSLNGYAVADSGVIYKYRNRPLDVMENDPAIPSASHLYQNYPNPFNPATTIRFNVAPSHSDERILLTVIDILGREVATLVNEEKPAGEYGVVWDARDFSSGVYFYKLRVGSFLDVKKMILVR